MFAFLRRLFGHTTPAEPEYVPKWCVGCGEVLTSEDPRAWLCVGCQRQRAPVPMMAPRRVSIKEARAAEAGVSRRSTDDSDHPFGALAASVLFADGVTDDAPPQNDGVETPAPNLFGGGESGGGGAGGDW